MTRHAWILLALAACSNEVGGDPAPDAAQAADALPANCTAAADLGDLGPRTGTPMASGVAGSRTVSVSMTVAGDAALRDVLFLNLRVGRGAFAGGDPAPGTYPITGADADFDTCGACLTLIGDLVAGQGPTQFYFATGGTVTLTSTAGHLTGSAADVTLQELDINSSQLVKGGCTSRVAAVSFDVALP
ncbi:MAG: hypothetical protein K8W52_33625 [Deltaproteobacteria bacterium]|nr:hypothetical protein [Deltaproteobacteria bacterium]